ncbi:hypothetical protein CR970_04315 [Candidatus Saccharibacteria bacterium]|nr:MAG: hypothetical protein CR970_04315 [Candidatus Saccharibacteria bacterium]
MANLVRSENLIDLPVFPNEEIAWNKLELVSTVKNTDRETMVRLLRFTNCISAENLTQLYDKADETFESFADAAGIDVIPHEFGLAKIPLKHRAGYNNAESLRGYYGVSFPDGYIPAATVAIVRSLSNIPPKETRRIAHIARNNQLHQTDEALYWSDASTSMRQYVRGHVNQRAIDALATSQTENDRPPDGNTSFMSRIARLVLPQPPKTYLVDIEPRIQKIYQP